LADGTPRDRRQPRAPGRWRTAARSALATITSAAVVATGLVALGATPANAATDKNPSFRLTKADLEDILKHITISENHAAGNPLLCESRSDTSGTCVPDPKLAWGLRTVDGSYNNLMEGQEQFGSGLKPFPRTAPAHFQDAEPAPYNPAGPKTSYKQNDGVVYDAEPRMISNLIHDQTVENPAALAALARVPGSTKYDHDNDPATPDRIFIPNESPDVGLSSPFSSWFTLFGQFFDHGLDMVAKGGNGVVLVPLKPDDPLYDPNSHTNFIPLTRATHLPGPDGIHGTQDDVKEHVNRTTPFIDQNQTYTSHPSHQVFLREYKLVDGKPVPTGKLLDGAKGGMATWAEVKAQAREKLGIELDDMDVHKVPLVATDPYGHLIPGTNGMPQLVQLTDPSAPDTEANRTLVEGSLATPVDASPALKAGHAFLDDIANGAAPALGADGNLEEYDSTTLDAHYMTGDGRGNENIGLTAVHHVFHSEHNRVAKHVEDVLEASGDADLIAKWHATDKVWDYGERLFQAARFVTEMEYQHLVFEEFVRTISPTIDNQPLNETAYHADINPDLSAEFAHAVYRFGHTMLTDTIAREGHGAKDLSLFDGFLNPKAFTDNGRMTHDQGAAAVLQGMSKQTGNGIDEFIDDTLRNQLLGLPLDLATINIARARDTGTPTLQQLREKLFAETQDSSLKPYANWEEFGLALKHPESLVNFIAAYGNHNAIKSATTVEAKRAAAQLVMKDPTFLTKDGKETGLWRVDLWSGGLAESGMQFGGMLGSTFNAVFEGAMEDLQNGDRFYYLNRTIGMNLIHQLEANSFSELVLRNTDASSLHHNIFASPDAVFDLSDPASMQDPEMQIRGDQYRYTGDKHVVMHGTKDPDSMRSGKGDDSLWGHDDNDAIEGDQGNDILVGNAGDDILTDLFGDDVIHGGDGDDAINAGSGLDLIFGGFGSDFILHGQDPTQSFAGGDVDFVRGGNANDTITGNEDDDWLEGAGGHDLVQGDNALTFQNDPRGGADILFGGPGNDDHDAEGGDDIMLNNGIDRHAGMLGFDWVTHKHDPFKADSDLDVTVFQPPNVTMMRSRFMNVEGLSGWDKNDVLRGRSFAGDPALADGSGHELTTAHIDRIKGLRELLGGGEKPPYASQFMQTNDANDILLGGAGSDIIEGRAGDDLIDGDAWLDVYLLGPNGQKADSMVDFQADIFAGKIKPSELQIVREIVTPTDQAEVIDTAVYGDVRANHELTRNANGTWTVAHVDDNAGALSTGVDTLRNIERVQFADEVVDLVALANSLPTGTVTISPEQPVEDQEVTATHNIEDADGIREGTTAYTWEWGSDETGWTASSTADGTATFVPGDEEAGNRLRVTVTYTDQMGAQEQVVSEPTAVVQNVNDEPSGLVVAPDTPMVGEEVTADGLVDADGLPEEGLAYQWQVSSGGDTWSNIASATGASFTPTMNEGAKLLRVRVTYTDGKGTAETATSPATTAVTVPVTVPDAPGIGQVTAGNGEATVAWTAPASDGGDAITGYVVEVAGAGGTPIGEPRAVAAGATQLRVTGLTNGTAYTFRVRAVNSVGEGAWSASSAPVTPEAPAPTTPGVPTGTKAVAGNTSATVSWTPPASDGDSPITSYDIAVITSAGNRTVTGVPASATSHTVTGLTNGASYTFRVRARNAAGIGTYSTPTSAVTPKAPDTTAPAVASRVPAPGNTAASTTGSVTVVFSEPVTGISATSVTLRNVTNGTSVPAKVTYNATTRAATLKPSAKLLEGHRYTVTVTGSVKDTSGNALKTTTWSFTTQTLQRMNDFDGDGRVDILTRDSSGKLWLYPGNGRSGWNARKLAGNGGWNGMTAITGAGDVTGDGKADMWARDSKGRLWLYPGTGKGTFSARKQVGTGWNGMTAITGTGDLTGDRRGDLVARDNSGKLWLYPGNGKGGFTARRQIGSGWNVMNAVIAAGDVTGDARPDLIARDSSGKLWLYPGNGRGGLSARKMIGTGGWNTMTALVAPGDFSGDGRADLLARDSSGRLWMYPSTGKGTLGARKQVGGGWRGFTAIL
jgi:hypothetical protein